MKQFFKTLVVLSVLVLTSANMFAQGRGNLRGTIKDASGETLPGACVFLQGSTNGTATDINGVYTLQGVPAGKATYTVSYLGYKDLVVEVAVEAGKTTIKDFVLEELTTSIQAVTVTAAVDGQQRALNQQKMADNQMQVVSADQIGLFPDLNVTDALKRVSGITTDGGQVSLRGTPTNFTNINMNGEQLMGVGENGQRAVDLSFMSSDVLSSMEIQKTLLPSNDGDAIAGAINLRSAEARSLKPKFSLEGGPGYNALRSKPTGNIKAGYEQRFHATDKNPYGTFGVAVKLSYYNTLSGNDRLDANDWQLMPVKGLKDAEGNTISDYMPLDYRLRYTTTKTQRTGISAVLDWAPSVNTKFVLIGNYNGQNTITERDRDRFRFRGAYYLLDGMDLSGSGYDQSAVGNIPEGAIAADRVQRIRQFSDMESDIQNYSLQLNGESVLGNWKIDGGLSWSTSQYAYSSLAYGFQTPDYRANGKDINGTGSPALLFTKNTPVAYLADIHSHAPAMTFIKAMNGGYEGRNWDQAENYFLYNIEEWDWTNNSSTYTAKANATYNHEIGGNAASLQFGVKDKMTVSSGYVPENGSYTLSGSFAKKQYGNEALAMTKFLTDPVYDANFLNNTMTLKYGLDKQALRDFYRNGEYDGLLSFNQLATDEAVDAYFFNAVENTLAGYMMEKIQMRKLMILAGARIEANHVSYEANKIFDYDKNVDLSTNPSGQDPANLGDPDVGPQYTAYTKTLESKSIDYFMVLPNVQFKYDLNPTTIFRLAYTTGYARPDAADLVPKTSINRDAGIVTMGNPDLKPAFSHNVDLLGEHYLKNVGLISGGIFYKNIDKFVYLQQVGIAGTTSPYNYVGTPFSLLRQKQNGKSANVYGAEVTFNSTLSFLPGFLKNLVFTSNYTFVHSDATVERYDDAGNSELVTIRLPGQADHMANVALAYSDKRFTLQVSGNFIGKNIVSLGANEEMDIWLDNRWQMDANASVNIMKGLSFYVEANNLLNSPIFQYMGNEGRVYMLRYNGVAARCGFRYRF